MGRYLLGRAVRGALSAVIVVTVVMGLIYSCLDRNLIFANDPVLSKYKSNAQQAYKMRQWEAYGYLDYVTYSEYLSGLSLEPGEQAQAAQLGDTGRILVRESGTEPVIRVMVEAPEQALCTALVDRVVDVICARGHARV